MTGELSVGDRLDIAQTVARYAHILNNGDFEALHLVFTADAVLATVGVPDPLEGIDAIRQALSSRPIPDHLTVNSCIDVVDGEVRVWSMFLVVTAEGTTVNGDYLDVVVPAAGGWRIARRTVIRRTMTEERSLHAAAYAPWLYSGRPAAGSHR